MNDKVCPRCGTPITKKEITEKSCFTNHQEVKTMENVCETCSKITNWGVSRSLYEDAVKFVKNTLGVEPPKEANKKYDPDWHYARMDEYHKTIENACHCLEYAKELHEESKKELLEMVPQVRNEEDAPFKGSTADNRYVVGWNDAALYFKHLIGMNL